MYSVLGTNNPNWERLASAPANLSAFEKKYPSDHIFWYAMKSAGYETYEDFYKAYKSSSPVQLPKKFLEQLGNNDKLKSDLDNYFRAQLLRDVLKLDPQRIVNQHKKYGNMDWRTPEAHAIYWAEQGVEKSPKGEDLNCARIITQALYEAFRSGKLLLIDDKDMENIQVIPNLDLVDSVYDTFWKTQQIYDPDSGAYSTFRSARINFMKEAVTILYNYGRFKKAEEYYQKLVAEDGKKPPLEQFVIQEWTERVRNASVKRASEIVSGLIYRSVNYLLYNDIDAAIAQEKMARTVYRNYMKEFGDSERTKLPPYQRMKREVVNACLLNLPPQMAQALKAKIEAEQSEARMEKQFLDIKK
jgi:tetratricopeptide (TPR) repeat protein